MMGKKSKFINIMFLLIFIFYGVNSVKGPNLRLSAQCTAKKYCFEKHKLYPKNIIENILKKESITILKTEMPVTLKTMALRQDMDDNDCDKVTWADKIYEVVDKNNNTRIVVQSDKFTQVFRVEECVNPGRIVHQTRHFAKDLVQQHNLHCVERTLAVNLLVLNEEWTDIELVEAVLPVACSCVWMGLSV